MFAPCAGFRTAASCRLRRCHEIIEVQSLTSRKDYSGSIESPAGGRVLDRVGGAGSRRGGGVRRGAAGLGCGLAGFSRGDALVLWREAGVRGSWTRVRRGFRVAAFGV